MNMQDQLQKLADAVSALEGSKARVRLLQLFDEGTFVEIDRLTRDGDKPVEAVAGYGLNRLVPVPGKTVDLHKGTLVKQLQKPYACFRALQRGNGVGELLKLVLHVHIASS